MHEKFQVNANVKLKPNAEKTWNSCEIIDELTADSIMDFKGFYQFCLINAARQFGSSKFSIVSIKLTIISKPFQIQVNLQPFEGELINVKIKIQLPENKIKELGLDNLIAHLEKKAKLLKTDEFEMIIYVMIIPLEKEDFTSAHF